MANTSAFHQVNQLFAQILSVVSGALEGLRHQQKVGAVVAAGVFGSAFQVPVKDRAADLIDLRIGFQYPICRFQIAVDESLVHDVPAFFPECRP